MYVLIISIAVVEPYEGTSIVIYNVLLFVLKDPFLLVSKVVENGDHIPICKTEAIKNDHNPTWKQVFLNVQQVGSKV